MSETQVREVDSFINGKDHNFTSCQKISLLNQSCKSRFFIRILLMLKHLVKKFFQTCYLFQDRKKCHFQNDATLGTLEMYPLNPVLSYLYF